MKRSDRRSSTPPRKAASLIAILVGGLIAAGLLTGSLSRLLYGVEPRDPLTFSVVAVLLCVVAFVATALAGRRASRVDPIEALRAD